MLQVGIVGAGVAGLSAAIALSRAGHQIEIFERSQFRNETGAAINVGPNGTRILADWNFDFDKAGAVDCNRMTRVRADSLEVDSEEDIKGILERYGSRWCFFHRADLHAGLKALAESQGPQVKVRLGDAIVDVDVETGVIQLEDGTEIKKDLVVIADGARSELISRVIGRPYPVMKSPMSMYRFLQPYERILNNPQTGKFYRGQATGFTTFYKAEVGKPGLLLNTYPCRNEELLYIALLHPTKPKEKDLEGWNSPADAQDVISDAKGFHPAVQSICEGATDVKVYTNMWRDPIETLIKGQAVLIGDAGHLMFPTHGQGACMALEDAVALGVLFANVSNPEDIQPALSAYDKLRIPRVSAVQTMSNKMMGPPEKMASEIRRYYSGAIPGLKAKTFSQEFNDFFFLYDVAEEARKMQ